MGDTAAGLLTIGVLVLLLAATHVPLGAYLANVFTTDRHWRVERRAYRLCGVNPDQEQPWTVYAASVGAFSVVSFLLLFLVILAQGWLPLNHGESMHLDTALNTAVSFVTNTNWQSYAGEAGTSVFVQAVGLTVQNFASAAVGIAVVAALHPGHRPAREPVHRQLLGRPDPGRRPSPPADRRRRGRRPPPRRGHPEPRRTDRRHRRHRAAQSIPGGLVASQEAIKELGTNGGGFFNANSAHPFENPNALTNLFEIFLLLVIPFALPRAYGIMVGDRRQGHAILAFMTVLWGASVALTTWAEVASGTMEGKETRFGIWSSTLFAASTTAPRPAPSTRCTRATARSVAASSCST